MYNTTQFVRDGMYLEASASDLGIDGANPPSEITVYSERLGRSATFARTGTRAWWDNAGEREYTGVYCAHGISTMILIRGIEI